ncbi:zinc finger protein 800 isoform 2-T2 [Discoglossus pictus]
MYRRLILDPEQNKNEVEVEDSQMHTQKTLVRDKYCQTDNQDGSCESASVLEPGDPPILQQQLQTSKSGILQIIECFRSGTKQLKHMLLKEVDTIFECKSCRSLFRGLPNLITHKQFYCISKLRMDENPSNENDKHSRAIKDLLEAIYPRVEEPEYVIRLEPIQTNQNAVFQFVTPVGGSNDDLSKGNMPEPAVTQTEESTSAADMVPETEKVEPPPAVRLKKEVASRLSAELQSQMANCTVSVKRAVIGNPFSCRVCKKDFNCRRSIRRHIKKVHKKKLEEIKKLIEIHRKPILTTGKGEITIDYSPSGTCCHMCHKSYATRANLRRHIDEVHKGMRRDSGTSQSPTKSAKNVSTETVSPKKSLKTQKPPVNSDFTLSSCKCPHCKRRYTSRFLLKKHMQIVHKAVIPAVDSKKEKGHNHTANTDGKVKAEASKSVESSSASGSHSPKNELKGTPANEKKNTQATQKNKVKADLDSPKKSPAPVSNKKKYQKTKFAAGFDFKQLFCKLCKRQFTSKQNLTKHIELHTDGNGIYVKFYRCPLCTYETRRKRDVIRHITVVHKKSSRALIKLTANLESRAVKKSIECVLNKVTKRGPQRDSAKVSARQSGTSSPGKKSDGGESGIEVKVTKNFSLLKCNKCGKAFAKKSDLDQHKKDHKNSSTVETKTKGRSKRLKTQ